MTDSVTPNTAASNIPTLEQYEATEAARRQEELDALALYERAHDFPPVSGRFLDQSCAGVPLDRDTVIRSSGETYGA